MKHTTWDKAPSLNPVEGVKITILGSKDNLTLCHIFAEPGAVIADHNHPNEQIGTCIKGVGELTSGGKVLKTIPGTSWTIPANETHRYINTGTEPVEMIEAFSPPREDYTSVAK